MSSKSHLALPRDDAFVSIIVFLALAMYIGVDAARALWGREAPDRSVVGIIVLALSVVVMPWLANLKRAVARALSSDALKSDATQTALCAYLSAIALVGVGLNASLGWWWSDPVAALVMVPIIAREGIEGIRGRDPESDGQGRLGSALTRHAP